MGDDSIPTLTLQPSPLSVALQQLQEVFANECAPQLIDVAILRAKGNVEAAIEWICEQIESQQAAAAGGSALRAEAQSQPQQQGQQQQPPQQSAEEADRLLAQQLSEFGDTGADLERLFPSKDRQTTSSRPSRPPRATGASPSPSPSPPPQSQSRLPNWLGSIIQSTRDTVKQARQRQPTSSGGSGNNRADVEETTGQTPFTAEKLKEIRQRMKQGVHRVLRSSSSLLNRRRQAPLPHYPSLTETSEDDLTITFGRRGVRAGPQEVYHDDDEFWGLDRRNGEGGQGGGGRAGGQGDGVDPLSELKPQPVDFGDAIEAPSPSKVGGAARVPPAAQRDTSTAAAAAADGGSSGADVQVISISTPPDTPDASPTHQPPPAFPADDNADASEAPAKPGAGDDAGDGPADGQQQQEGTAEEGPADGDQ
ncbi:unnamed protein product [Vitrella brassicaformis CCMP3155]|uniref:CUE domain-containing protein n=1 Tax=Vitrella brassicaformis (strain CCMP3155) TaxID=1169540 RepID=A0A0G4ELM7_VITBC|nr:unnamed protein product [Vitrella brassicaformis CCMP3155]|eukprot:CEL97733.1 unnamed protein product [Vitrella brassicaformis CCMP3155]